MQGEEDGRHNPVAGELLVYSEITRSRIKNAFHLRSRERNCPREISLRVLVRPLRPRREELCALPCPKTKTSVKKRDRQLNRPPDDNHKPRRSSDGRLPRSFPQGD